MALNIYLSECNLDLNQKWFEWGFHVRMVLKVYNTATRKKEVFKSLEKDKVKMYVCGITPYDVSHVGHARSYVAFDVIRRALEFLGYEVSYVQNFTDVDDKIIGRAKKEGQNPLTLSDRYIGEYFKDMDDLSVRRADSYPRVSEKIPDIIQVIEALIEKGIGYEARGDVYLEVKRIKGYGKLSGQTIDELVAGARVEVDVKKKNPLDFALWKRAEEGEPSWSSPWGEGRPGWHIECSVMSIFALGDTIDIHGGGQDLIFPHHENEIAQSESYTGKPFVRYWLHNGLVTVEGKKMSKSLGNFITIRELFETHSPQSLRFFLLSAHYRRPLDFSKRALKDSEKGLNRIQTTIFNVKNTMTHENDNAQAGFKQRIKEAKKGFRDALEDDFNVPRALAVVFDFIRELNSYTFEEPDRKSLEEALDALKEMGHVFGLSFEKEVEPRLQELIETIIEVRYELRAQKNFAAADEVRRQMLNLGILLEDQGERTVWRFVV
jgi:cysteinyl-tRNA synthetase